MEQNLTKIDFENYIDRITSKKMYHAINIQNVLINSFVMFMTQRGVKQMMPLMLAAETDPLSNDVFDASIQYYENTLSLMKSMILHKQIILSNPKIESIYIISPNVRLEKKDNIIKGRHLIEFTQVDFEFKNKDKHYVKSFIEDLLIFLIVQIKENCKKDLDFFERELKIPQKPFATYNAVELKKKYRNNYEDIISKESSDIFWIENFDRWFYDKEDPNNEGNFLNYDVIYPMGFGEGSSGAEREADYGKLIKRMIATNCNPNNYERYLSLAKDNIIPQTAGAGIGFERLLRYVCGIMNVEEICLFARNAGEKIIL